MLLKITTESLALQGGEEVRHLLRFVLHTAVKEVVLLVGTASPLPYLYLPLIQVPLA
jgi:hypothetical protein